jgi:ribosomal protein S18 acetylase RimI-like enzyme
MEHRLAALTDIDRIMEIVGQAQSFMKANGVDQWQNGYPTREAFESDIQNGGCHVFLIDGRVAGLITVLFKNEKSYAYVEDGAWLTENAPYSVFHRAAVGESYRGLGIASQMLSYAENIAAENGFKSIRGDSHRDNKAMRGLLEKRGFVHCGTIYLDESLSDGSERVCYEKLL